MQLKHSKNSIYLLATFLCLSLFLYACKSEEPTKKDDNISTEKKVYDIWRIDYDLVESGCERLDCIRSIDHPKFIGINAVDFMADDDLVIGIKIGNEIKCYPHPILNWHEIVNDNIDGKQIAINYCPLTGSGMAWNRNINGKLTDFGVSGMLYNSNVIPYDRTTRSAWSQMKQLCVNGALMDSSAETFQVLETSWKTWKTMYPESKVVSTETDMKRDYLSYPYHDYRESESIYFDVEFESKAMPQKERLFGMIENGNAKCYRFKNFKGGLKIINDNVFDRNVIIVGSEPANFITAFENPENIKYTSVKTFPGIIKDNEGNIYDAFGYCLEGAKKDSRLTPVNGFIAYWFAWYAFYPEVVFE